MGKHIVPRHLLRRISPDGKNIWQYDKKSTMVAPRLLPIAKVSQTKDFYDEDIEKLLSTIESSASPILDRLTQGQQLNFIERRVIAIYLEMCLGRDRGKREEVTRELKDRDKIESFLDALMEPVRETSLYPDYESQKEDAIESIEAHPEIVLSSKWKPSNLIRLLFYQMTWRVVESDTVDFVISEPPVTITGVDIGHPEAQVLFPLSSRQILHISWRGSPFEIQRISVPLSVASDINKILVCKADRFVFFNKNCSKLAKLVRKRHLYDDKIVLEHLPVLGVNPHRPRQPLIVTDETQDESDVKICMHPAASDHEHVWRKAENHRIIDGGKVMEWCIHCGMAILNYGGTPELIRNNEVYLATGRFGPHRNNWWTNPAIVSRH